MARSRLPTSGLLAPVPLDVLRARADGREVIAGARDYHAVVTDEPGDMQWAERLATELSAGQPGTFYAFGSHPDYEWLTTIENGRTVSSDEGAVDAERFGVTLVPPVARPASYLVVENATPEQVADALGGGPAPRRHLEKTALGTLGWTEGADLGFLASRVSRELGRRTFAVVDDGTRFRVRIHEHGTETGRFEVPATSWSEPLRVNVILGAITLDEIRRKLGRPST